LFTFDMKRVHIQNTVAAYSALASLNVYSESTLGPLTTWMGDCSRAGKPSGYVTTIQVDSAFYPLWDGKISISFRAE